MINAEIQELLALNQQVLSELTRLINSMPTRIETIKEFLTSEIMRHDYSNESKILLLKELRNQKEIEPWLVDEIYAKAYPVVTLTR